MNFKDLLGKQLIFFDGAMGTLLQNAGLPSGCVPEEWNLTHADIIKSIHLDYLKCGCNVISTNSFGANRVKLPKTMSVEEVTLAAVRAARSAVDELGVPAFVALDIGPTGHILEPFGDLSFEDAYSAYAEQIVAGVNAGADLIIIETMSDIYEIKAALLAAKENSSLPVVATATLEANGRLLCGADPACVAAVCESLGADAVGFNCGFGPDKMLEFLPTLTSFTDLPVVVNPNAGIPCIENGKTVFRTSPDEFARCLAELVRGGCCGVGGCCGTTPEHIYAAVKACRDIPLAKREKHSLTFVSSRTKTAVFGSKTMIIGERINPTGKPKLRQALRDGDLDYLCDEALSQEDAGADILDVNVGISEIDEAAILVSAINEIQCVSSLPLQIDTTKQEALEPALRIYNGKPLINSVNGGKTSMETVFPLAKKYGAAVVALTLDENGIPETAEGRIEIAKRILAEAEKYGIEKRNLIFDTLAMTISTGQDSVRASLDALDYIRNTLGVHTVLGVSNISFGLPKREYVNAAFFTMAMQRGLSAGIVNPMNEQMMNAYFAFNALAARDPSCAAYIARFSDNATNDSDKEAQSTLFSAVLSGLRERSATAAAELLKSVSPMEVINLHLVPALDEVGSRFETGKLFLPQLLLSASAATAAFEVIRATLEKSGEKSKSKGKIILATVKGDIHDIGKNIVKVLLQNYGYDIIDLGRNVEPERVCDAVIESGATLVGLSALMTTTVSAMEDTIKLLREKTHCKIMVGGAVLTEEYAAAIGADCYSKDAMGSVRFAEKLFG